jgi:hypothetical protein
MESPVKLLLRPLILLLVYLNELFPLKYLLLQHVFLQAMLFLDRFDIPLIVLYRLLGLAFYWLLDINPRLQLAFKLIKQLHLKKYLLLGPRSYAFAQHLHRHGPVFFFAGFLGLRI